MLLHPHSMNSYADKMKNKDVRCLRDGDIIQCTGPDVGLTSTRAELNSADRLNGQMASNYSHDFISHYH